MPHEKAEHTPITKHTLCVSEEVLDYGQCKPRIDTNRFFFSKQRSFLWTEYPEFLGFPHTNYRFIWNHDG